MFTVICLYATCSQDLLSFEAMIKPAKFGGPSSIAEVDLASSGAAGAPLTPVGLDPASAKAARLRSM